MVRSKVMLVLLKTIPEDRVEEEVSLFPPGHHQNRPRQDRELYILVSRIGWTQNHILISYTHSYCLRTFWEMIFPPEPWFYIFDSIGQCSSTLTEFNDHV